MIVFRSIDFILGERTITTFSVKKKTRTTTTLNNNSNNNNNNNTLEPFGGDGGVTRNDGEQIHLKRRVKSVNSSTSNSNSRNHEEMYRAHQLAHGHSQLQSHNHKQFILFPLNNMHEKYSECRDTSGSSTCWHSSTHRFESSRVESNRSHRPNLPTERLRIVNVCCVDDESFFPFFFFDRVFASSTSHSSPLYSFPASTSVDFFN